MKIFDEFKKFISRGNVIDMAVGVVMGTAFTKIVNSLVTNIITPAISILTGKINVAELAYVVNEELSITYGQFLQAIIDFFLIAISVFLMVKIMNTLKDKFSKVEEEPAPAPEEPKPSEEVLLLTEIRDLLKK
ncbi:MAG: large-conductance mechanosensitive channel protein MscL [Clostridia bacterium]|nr:large-conductance mechanosensitive channel protein MscL [Clostridia bacterium]